MRSGLAVSALLSLLAGPALADRLPEPAPEPASEPLPDPAPDPAPEPAPDPSVDPTPTSTSTPTGSPIGQVNPYDPATAPPPAGWRLMLSDLTVFRLNPLGLETRGRFGLQKRLYASDKAVTQNNFAFFGVFPKLNPASAALAAGFEIQPASVFNLRGSAEVQKFFGTFGFLQSFASPLANYSDHQLDELADDPAHEPQTATALRVGIQPTLQAKVGPIAIRAMAQLDYWDLRGIRAGDTAAYEATFDTLLPDRGWTLTTDSDLLYVGRPGLALGVRHSYVRPFYQRRHFASDAEEAAYDNDNAHHRIGLFAAYTLRDRGPSRFNKPTLILIASWYLSHRYRTGEPDAIPTGGTADDYTSRAFPYLLVGFAFESDFLAVR